MDATTARTVVLVGAAIGSVIWLLGLRAYTRLAAEPARFRKRLPVRSAGPEAFAELVRWGTGDGRQILQKGDRSLRVKHVLCEMDLSLSTDASGPVLEVRADLSSLRRKYLIGVGIVVFGVAPALLVGLTYGLLSFAVTSPQPALRAQAFQIFQCIHGLWPPLVFSSQYRRLGRRLLEPVPANLQALIDVTRGGPAEGSGS